MIKPTVGRVVWFYPGVHLSHIARVGDQPFAATVAAVWSDTCVNIGFLDANGHHHNATSVPLIQDDMPRPDSHFCEWMPYQKGQAAKTEALEGQLGAASGARY